jgi:hypothetical protein
MQRFPQGGPTVSRRFHRFARAVLGGTAGLLAFTVLITSRPAVTPASAAPDPVVPVRPVVETPVERGWSQAKTGLPDPRQRLFNLRR